MPVVMAYDQEAAARSREDTKDMNRERAETQLRLLAEAELRHATAIPVGSAGQWHAQRLFLAAQALTAVGAVEAGAAEQLQAMGSSLDGDRYPRPDQLGGTSSVPVHRARAQRAHPGPYGRHHHVGHVCNPGQIAPKVSCHLPPKVTGCPARTMPAAGLDSSA